MDSEQAIREREQQQTNDTPALANGGDDSEQDAGRALPVPNLSRTQLAIIGAVVAAIIIWKLYKSSQDGDGGSLSEAMDRDWSGSVDIEADVDGDGDDDLDVEISIPRNSDSPLDADAAVADAFRKSGRLSEKED